MIDNKELSYEEALNYLHNRTKFGINLGLQRIEGLLNEMGNPHKENVKYIHIGGTNGKGSTSAMVNGILTEWGKKTGMFTSPHLHSYCERMRINTREISEDNVVKLIRNVAPIVEEIENAGKAAPTEFEVNTAIALKYFTEEKCDYAIMEVGLGGDIDSTNVILPEVSVITNVAFDHMDYLGNTLTEIATAKGGIIKENTPVICGSREPEVIKVIEKIANEKNAPLYLIDRDFKTTLISENLNGQKFSLEVKGKNLGEFSISLLGHHQLDNVACAIMVGLVLGVDLAIIKSAISKVKWNGRLEVISKMPYILLDGAHNVAGMKTLTNALDTYWKGKKIVAIVGMLGDKEREKTIDILAPYLSYAVVTKVNNNRAGNWERIGELLGEHNVAYELEEDNRKAGRKGLERLALGKEDILLVAGSLYMLSDVRAYFLETLRKTPLILASTSPRRKELLEELGIDFTIEKAVGEEMMAGLSAEEIVKINAYYKAREVWDKHKDSYVLGADTIVVLDNKILGKPKDKEDAFNMLKSLSGKTHSVLTGVALINEKNQVCIDYLESKVKFKTLSDNEIKAYIETGEPLDKAGAYGIQGLGRNLVENINGDFQNIVGLPMKLVNSLSAKILV